MSLLRRFLQHRFRPVAPSQAPAGARYCDELELLHQILGKVHSIMASLDDIKAAVAAETTVAQSAVTLLTQLHDEIAAANAAGDQQKITDILAGIKANTDALSGAVTANTDAAPTPPAA